MMIATFTSTKISKFLMVSYLSNRRKRRDTQMNDEIWNSIANAERGSIPSYTRYGLEAEDFLDALVAWRERQTHMPREFQSIQVVATSRLSDEPGTGMVAIHPEKTDIDAELSRQDVAEVISQLLGRPDTGGQYALLGGKESIGVAIDRAVGSQERLDEGEVFKNVVGGFVE